MRRVDELLAPEGSPLGGLVRGARRQQRLDALLAGFLDRPLADHVQVACDGADVLVLAADAPVWGHRIRYLAPSLLERMREEVPGLRDVRIIVRPPADPPRATPAPRRVTGLSAASASLLQEVAGRCANPALSRVLARMAARVRRGA